MGFVKNTIYNLQLCNTHENHYNLDIKKHEFNMPRKTNVACTEQRRKAVYVPLHHKNGVTGLHTIVDNRDSDKVLGLNVRFQ